MSSHTATGDGPSSRLLFNGDESRFELWKVKFYGHLKLQGLESVYDEKIKDEDLDDNKNEIAFAELVQVLDDASLKLIMYDAKDDGRKALQILNNHYGQESVVSTKVFVGSLPDSIKKDEIKALFGKYGKVVECDVFNSKHFGFVHFEKGDDAKVAVAALNDSEFQGATIKVELSNSRVRKRPGMGGTDECFKCGKEGHWSRDCPRGSRRRRGGGGSRYSPYDRYDRDPYMDSYYGDKFRDFPDPYARQEYYSRPRNSYPY